MNIIEIENLSHCFSNGTLGIKNINLSIQEGEFIVVGGQNGSGKTTLLKHLNGLLLPNSGSVRVAGFAVSQNLKKARQIVGETVYDDVAFGPENLCLNRNEIDRRVSSALDAVGLAALAEQKSHLLSGGEKRRLAIAGVLAMEPKVIVFDEPFSNLDYPGVSQVLQEVLSLYRAGHTIIVATHELEKIIAHADRLIIMKDGSVARDGVPEIVLRGIEAFGVREPCDCWKETEVRSCRS